MMKNIPSWIKEKDTLLGYSILELWQNEINQKNQAAVQQFDKLLNQMSNLLENTENFFEGSVEKNESLEDKFGELKLLNFSEWYSEEIVRCLLVEKWLSLPKQERKNYFVFSIQGSSFQEKIILFHEEILNKSIEAVFFTSIGLSIEENLGILNPHFYAFVLTEEFLLIVNPTAKQPKEEELNLFTTINQKLPSLKIVFSNNVFQDEKILVSCGPIATELTRHWMSAEQLKLLCKVINSPNSKSDSSNKFSDVSLPEGCVPESLHGIKKNETESNKKLIEKIRIQQLESVKHYDLISENLKLNQNVKNIFYNLNSVYLAEYINSHKSNEDIERIEICKAAIGKKENITEKDLIEIKDFIKNKDLNSHLTLTFYLAKLKKQNIKDQLIELFDNVNFGHANAIDFLAVSIMLEHINAIKEESHNIIAACYTFFEEIDKILTSKKYDELKKEIENKRE